MNNHLQQAFIRQRSARRGMTLVEMVIAASLLGVLFGAVGQFLGRWEAARRAAEERVLALRAVENVLERSAAAVRRQTGVTNVALPADVEARLNAPRLEVSVGSRDESDLSAVTASLSWRNPQGEQVAPVVLTAWLPVEIAPAGGQP
jgi:prepilin-type N-terminal cleavage/methylation domain-containing protein